jgi:hypothetical protein
VETEANQKNTSRLLESKKENGMKNFLNQMNIMISRVNRRHIQFLMVLLYLTLFVLGAGAPGAESDIGM